MEKLFPTTLTKTVHGRSYPVVVHDAQAMVQSLLYSGLMQESNMLFPNLNDPLAPPLAIQPTVGDIMTGRAFYKAHKLLCMEPNHILCPFIMYLDKLTVDCHGHLSLEPLYFTLGLFN